MIIKRSIFSALLVCLCLLIFTQTYAFKFSQLYFFGDSLSDAGNNPEGPFTNFPGTVWAQFLGQKFGKSITKSNAGGTDYAYGGATTSTGFQNVNQQVSQFITSQGGHVNRNGLYSVWDGANNIIDALESFDFNLIPVLIGAANGVRSEVLALHNAGARFIMVGNLPDIGDTPGGRQFGPAISEVLNRASNIFNNFLREQINALPFDVIQLDFAGLFREILANPQSFGFTNTTVSCDPSGTCNGFLFTRSIHPTVAAHKIIADYAFSVLTAPNFAGTLAVIPFASIASVNSMISQQLAPNIINADNAPVQFFASGNISPHNHPTRAHQQQHFHSDNYHGALGLIYTLSPFFQVGGAYSHGFNETKFDDNAGNIDWYSQFISLFSSFNRHHIYVNTIFSGGLLNFDHIKRHFYLGPKSTWALAHTNGYLYGVNLEGGWFIKQTTTWSTGPFAVASYNNVTVNHYREHGAGVADIVFGSQHNDNFITGLGWRARFVNTVKTIHLLTNIFASLNRQWLGGERNINFHVASMIGSHAYLPVNAPRSTFLNAGANVAAQLQNGFLISLGYLGSIGTNHLRAQDINLGLTIPLR